MLDLKNGCAVAAVAGERDHYQPVRSTLHVSSDPLELAGAVRDTLGLRSLYLADLDSIAGDAPDFALYENLIGAGFHLIVDAGLRNLQSAGRLLDLDWTSSAIVAALETLDGPDVLSEILAKLGAEQTVFSLDLFNGRPRIALPGAWSSDHPLELTAEAIERGARRLLLLDVARVGTGRGLGTLSLLSQIRAEYPEVEVNAGGGISRMAEVIELKDAGAGAALIASALHDGRIGLRELAELAG